MSDRRYYTSHIGLYIWGMEDWYQWLIWIMNGGLSAIFIWQGSTKLMGRWRTQYQRWGYPQGLMYLQGLAEIAAAVALWQDAYRFWSGLLMFVAVIAGIMTLTRYYEARKAYYLPLATLIWLIAWSFLET